VASPEALELPILDKASTIAKIETTRAALDLKPFSLALLSISMLLNLMSLIS